MTDLPQRPDPPVYSFPGGVFDRRGHRLRPGSVVRVADGPRQGVIGEVVGWAGSRGVEVLTQEEPPRIAAVDPAHLEVIASVLRDPVTPGAVVVEESDERPLLVLPVGGQDVQLRSGAPLGPFPAPVKHSSDRRGQTKVDARTWGRACVAALEGLGPDEAAAAVAQHLDAPMLRRVLNEAGLPRRVERLVLVVSDQTPPHRDDTSAFGELLRLWIAGTAEDLLREIGEVAPPVRLTSAPHIVSAVVLQVEREVSRTVEGCTVAAVVHAGGTPAMTYGTLIAYAKTTGIGLRHIQVPFGQPVMEVDFQDLLTEAHP